MTKKQLLKHPALQWCIVMLLYVYSLLVFYTIRWQKHIHPDVTKATQEGKPIITLIWHSRIFMAPFFRIHQQRHAAIISQHGDGAYVDKFMKLHNVKGIRGSTKTGAFGAFKQALSWLKQHRVLVITPDGPRGPARIFQSNAVALAQKTGAVIVPMTYSVSKCKKLNTWDKFLVPFPFCKGVLIFDEPVMVDAKIHQENGKKAGIELQNRLNIITTRADECVGAPVDNI